MDTCLHSTRNRPIRPIRPRRPGPSPICVPNRRPGQRASPPGRDPGRINPPAHHPGPSIILARPDAGSQMGTWGLPCPRRQAWEGLAMLAALRDEPLPRHCHYTCLHRHGGFCGGARADSDRRRCRLQRRGLASAPLPLPMSPPLPPPPVSATGCCASCASRRSYLIPRRRLTSAHRLPLASARNGHGARHSGTVRRHTATTAESVSRHERSASGVPDCPRSARGAAKASTSHNAAVLPRLRPCRRPRPWVTQRLTSAPPPGSATSRPAP
jgi:hypothetical protein